MLGSRQETTTHQVEGEADDFRHWVGTVGGGNAAGDGAGEVGIPRGIFLERPVSNPETGRVGKGHLLKEIGRFPRKNLQVMAERFGVLWIYIDSNKLPKSWNAHVRYHQIHTNPDFGPPTMEVWFR